MQHATKDAVMPDAARAEANRRDGSSATAPVHRRKERKEQQALREWREQSTALTDEMAQETAIALL